MTSRPRKSQSFPVLVRSSTMPVKLPWKRKTQSLRGRLNRRQNAINRPMCVFPWAKIGRRRSTARSKLNCRMRPTVRIGDWHRNSFAKSCSNRRDSLSRRSAQARVLPAKRFVHTRFSKANDQMLQTNGLEGLCLRNRLIIIGKNTLDAVR